MNSSNPIFYATYEELLDLIRRRIHNINKKYWNSEILSITINIRYRNDFYNKIQWWRFDPYSKHDFFQGYKINWSRNPRVIFRVNRKRLKRLHFGNITKTEFTEKYLTKAGKSVTFNVDNPI